MNIYIYIIAQWGGTDIMLNVLQIYMTRISYLLEVLDVWLSAKAITHNAKVGDSPTHPFIGILEHSYCEILLKKMAYRRLQSNLLQMTLFHVNRKYHR